MSKKKKKKGGLSTPILLLIFLIGLSLLLYPTVADYWNSMHSAKVITSYTESVASYDPETYDRTWLEARAFNEFMAKKGSGTVLSEQEMELYNQLLCIDNSGTMGYIEIPSINVVLPIGHGTEEKVLIAGAGHVEWSSLPTGGESTHCVLSGHRGLPSAQLFTNLDKLKEGDYFFLRVLNEVLTYEVDQILIVEPEEIEALHLVEGKDYCTLVTCTPYGVNSHRLLIRGERVENPEVEASIRVTADAIQIEPLIVAPMLSIPLILILFIVVCIRGGKRDDD